MDIYNSEIIEKLHQRIKELEEEIKQLKRPWSIILVGEYFQRHECDIVDIGFADHVIVVNSDRLDELETKLSRYTDLEKAAREIPPVYSDGEHKRLYDALAALGKHKSAINPAALGEDE